MLKKILNPVIKSSFQIRLLRVAAFYSSGFLLISFYKKIILNTINKTKNYKKFVAFVDDEDFERVSKHNWHVAKLPNTMYAVATIDGKQIRLHIFIMGFKPIDHIDGDGLNNQKFNLRKATQQENCMNRKSHKDSSSKYKGVSWHKRDRKWMAYICYDYKLIHLGLFTSEIEAAKAYNEKAIELFGEFAKLNVIET